MTDDGAHLGYGMEAALRGTLGDEEPPRRMTTMEMRDYLLTAPDEPRTYDDAGRLVGREVLRYLERHPEASDLEEVYEAMVEEDPTVADRLGGMTGFQWGWATNAARRCLELPPVPNPALVTVTIDRSLRS